MADNGGGWNAPPNSRSLSRLTTHRQRLWLGQGGVTQCLFRSAPAFDKDVLSPLPASITKSTGFLARLYKITRGVHVGANVHESNLAYADDIVILSSSYSEMQGLLEAVNCHATAVVMRINASNTKVLSALIPGEQRQAALLDGEPLEDVDKFKYLGSMFVADGQGTEESSATHDGDKTG